ncbi:hypothetical protein D3C73_1440660 [compost metagenome]
MSQSEYEEHKVKLNAQRVEAKRGQSNLRGGVVYEVKKFKYVLSGRIMAEIEVNLLEENSTLKQHFKAQMKFFPA